MWSQLLRSEMKALAENMKIRVIAIFAILACVATSGFSKKLEEFRPTFVVPDATEDYYFDTLKIIEKQDVSLLNDIDFVKFRRSFLEARDSKGLEISTELLKSYNEAMNAENPDGGLIVSLCEEILEKDYTDLNRHVIRNYFLEQQGKDVSFYREVTSRLIDSIMTSGDGRSPETAFHVFQVKEEYEIIKMFRMRMIEQTLISIGDHSFDIMECEDVEGNTFEIYFDITEHMEKIRAVLE